MSKTGSTSSQLPLAGIRVLEFCHTIMGPSAGMILADLGADVVKVEPAPHGDPTRRLEGFAAGFFDTFNRNKRSLAINLKSATGRELIHRLLTKTDVIIENYAPGAMEKLGCGFDTLSQRHPPLVYCQLKGFLSGPYAHRPALDEVVQFMGGLAYMTGPPGRPLRAGASVIDIMGGMFAVIAIQAALRDRAADPLGRGQLVKSALFETTAFLMAQHITGEAVTGRRQPPMPAREGAAWPVYQTFATKDGEQIFIGLTSDNHWRRFCEEFQRQDLLADPRFETLAMRVRERARIVPEVASIAHSHTRDQLVATFDRIGIPFAPVATPSDLADDPQVNANGRMLELTLANGKPCGIPGLPIEMSAHTFNDCRRPPAIGEHSRDILGEIGVTDRELRALIDADIVVDAAPAPS